MSKRPIGRPKNRWENDVLEDIKSMNVRNWKNVAQNTDRWKKVVEQARALTHCNTQPAVRRAEPSMPLLLILAFCQ